MSFHLHWRDTFLENSHHSSISHLTCLSRIQCWSCIFLEGLSLLLYPTDTWISIVYFAGIILFHISKCIYMKCLNFCFFCIWWLLRFVIVFQGSYLMLSEIKQKGALFKVKPRSQDCCTLKFWYYEVGQWDDLKCWVVEIELDVCSLVFLHVAFFFLHPVLNSFVVI